MNELFRSRLVRKYYWALVDNCPPKPQGELRHYLVKNSAGNISHAFDSPGEIVLKNAQKGTQKNPQKGTQKKSPKGGKEAKLRYKLKQSTRGYFLLEIEMLTGRHHQIRAQLAREGIHIRGDLKYGAKRSNPNGGISLHARSISFRHPVTKEELSITADPRPVQGDALWEILSEFSGG